MPVAKPLDWLDKKSFKVLYLAKDAPNPAEPKPSLHPTRGVRPIYHYEIYEILVSLGFQVEPCRSLERLVEGPRDFNYVFSLYNKGPFKDAEVFTSSVCEYLRVPYLGARPHVRSVAEDKHLTKILAEHLGVPVPKWTIYRRERAVLNPPFFSGPYFVKPRHGASSIEITEDSMQETWPGLQPQIARVFLRGDDAIVEEFVEGTNVTLPILGGDAPSFLPPVQTYSPKKGNVMTFPQKRMLDPSLSRGIFSDEPRSEELRAAALKIYKDIEPVDYMRVDYRVPSAADSPASLLEINICCNLGSHSTIALAARENGLSQRDMVAHILDYSLRRQNVAG